MAVETLQDGCGNSDVSLADVNDEKLQDGVHGPQPR
jgi:hypothetical protein